MNRGLPPPVVLGRWLALTLVACLIGLLNAWLLFYTVPVYTDHFGALMPLPMDWAIWTGIGEAYRSGTLYTFSEIPYNWSPLLAPVMAVVPLIGFWTWAALHGLALLLLRNWPIIGLVLVSAPFWSDVAGANAFTFVFVTGFLAIRGSRWAALAYLALCLLMPRPVALPLALWLLWHRPELRAPFAAMFTVNVIGVLATGYAADWAATTLPYAAAPMSDIGPTAVFGLAWMVIGVPLAAWLTWKGQVGWAGLAITPFVLTNYLIMPLISATPARWSRVPRP